ncbi:MAG: hypothetical protein EHM20_08170 [Alphaproteobacteria bacterium]|nr:MAG: hypothetical protein EHM20_08170 [Alphaproteobacteria bacterium]
MGINTPHAENDSITLLLNPSKAIDRPSLRNVYESSVAKEKLKVLKSKFNNVKFSKTKKIVIHSFFDNPFFIVFIKTNNGAIKVMDKTTINEDVLRTAPDI